MVAGRGRARTALPQRPPALGAALRLVERRPDLLVLHLAPGTPFRRAVDEAGRPHRSEDEDWRLGSLVHVNLQDPFRLDEHGYATEDHALDVVVEPDGSWRWKDEDELADAVRAGRVDEAAARAEGERVLAEAPFPTGWEGYRPDPDWPVPELPAGWDSEPRPFTRPPSAAR